MGIYFSLLHCWHREPQSSARRGEDDGPASATGTLCLASALPGSAKPAQAPSEQVKNSDIGSVLLLGARRDPVEDQGCASRRPPLSAGGVEPRGEWSICKMGILIIETAQGGCETDTE